VKTKRMPPVATGGVVRSFHQRWPGAVRAPFDERLRSFVVALADLLIADLHRFPGELEHAREQPPTPADPSNRFDMRGLLLRLKRLTTTSARRFGPLVGFPGASARWCAGASPRSTQRGLPVGFGRPIAGARNELECLRPPIMNVAATSL
jgi:hypothetical protein